MRPSDAPESGNLRPVDSFGYCEWYLPFYGNLLETLLQSQETTDGGSSFSEVTKLEFKPRSAWNRLSPFFHTRLSLSAKSTSVDPRLLKII